MWRAHLVGDRGGDNRLHEVTAQILLEVQDAEAIRLAQRQKLAQRGVSLDGLLVHQVVGLRVAHHTLGDGRAADLSALGVTQEGAELIRHLHRLGEDAGLGLTTLGLGGALLLAIRLLGQASRLLLNRLQRIAGSRGSGLEAGEVLLEGRDALLEGGTEVLIRDVGDGLRRGRHRGGHRGRRGNRRRCLNRLGGLLGDLGGSRGGRGSDGHRGRGGSGLRLYDGGLLGRLGGSAHFADVGGVNGRHLTRYTLSGIRVDSRVNFGVRHPQSCHPTLGRRVSFMPMPKVGMNPICNSIRGKTHPGEQCTHRAQTGSEWCGVHGKQTPPTRFIVAPPSTVAVAVAAADVIEHTISGPASPAKTSKIAKIAKTSKTSKTSKKTETVTATAEEKRSRPAPTDTEKLTLTSLLSPIWRRWFARRAGPLLRFREESNNPFDFFSADPVEEIPLCDFVSFVDGGKGYCMDIKSAVSLLEHAAKSGEVAVNPFNRAPLPAVFKIRIARHGKTAHWESLAVAAKGSTVAADNLSVTDTFRAMEDLGYYTDPDWFTDLSRLQLQRMYLELTDIWYHRAGLSSADRTRIVPLPANPFSVPVATVMVMQQRALRPVLLQTCRLLVSSAAVRGDKQTGVMYVLGVLAMVSAGASTAYPWLVEMLSPGVSRIVGNTIQLLHPGVLAY